MDEYYKRYTELHTNSMNIFLHILGNLATLWYIMICCMTGYYWWLLLSPIIVYPFAWTGHFFFENNVPAAFTNPIKAKISDWRMMWQIMMRTYPHTK